MEPLTIAVGALVYIAGGVAMGATGKLGSDLMDKAQAWFAQLRQHSPETAKRLASVSDPNVIDVEILEEVKRVAAQQPEVQTAMEEAVVAAATDTAQFPNLTKLADKIATVNLGQITTQINNYNF